MADTTTPAPTDAKPWYQSKTIIGILVTGLAFLLSKLHVNFTGLEDSLNNAVEAFMAFIGVVVGIWGRYSASKSIGASTTTPPTP